MEIDRRVVEVSKEFMPHTADSFSDPRVHLHYIDGLKYIRHNKKHYDLVIVDSNDPSGPGEVLFTKEFYGGCQHALTENGILVSQHDDPFYRKDQILLRRAHVRINDVFPINKVYQAHIPTYPTGHWLFGFASNALHPVNDMDAERWNALCIKTRYYNTNLHTGAFALPNYVEEGPCGRMDNNSLTFIGCDTAYADADIILFGVPFDGTASFPPRFTLCPACDSHRLLRLGELFSVR